MKKVLLASTALLLTAGFASAQSIELSGSANGGLKYNSGLFTDEIQAIDPTYDPDEVTVHNEVNMVIAGSGATDTGLQFGAFIDIDEDSVDDAEVFISGVFGTVTVGNVDPATDGFGIADVGFDGIGMDDPAEFLKNATAGADIHYTYSASGLTFTATAALESDDYAVAVEYEGGMFSAGIGYADADDDGSISLAGYLPIADPSLGVVPVTGANSTVTVAAGVTQGAVSANAIYSDWSTSDLGGLNAQSYGVDVSFDTGAATITGVYSNLDADDDLGGIINVDTYGVGASVPLGGGLTLAGGIGIIDVNVGDGLATDTATVADLGLTMSF